MYHTDNLTLFVCKNDLLMLLLWNLLYCYWWKIF